MRATERVPVVSILIAARNEETTILACLRAISQLDYPPEAFEVLIGNDHSTDRTSAVVAQYCADKPGFRLVLIDEQVGGLRGKANVLAQLARLARGRLLFFTDADTQVPPTWLTGMSQYFTGNTGIVAGVTLPDGPRLFHKLQAIDWLYSLTANHLASIFGMPITAMGNNMAVLRGAYDAVGGYESLPFSVVEDYTLFHAVVEQGYGFQALLDNRVLATTRPVDTLRAFFHQRKRWMRGAMQLPAWLVILLYGQYAAGPVLLLLACFAPGLAVGLYAAKLLVQTLIISLGLGRLQKTGWWPYALLFEGYQLVLGPLSIVFYWLPVPMEWKGKRYE